MNRPPEVEQKEADASSQAEGQTEGIRPVVPGAGDFIETQEVGEVVGAEVAGEHGVPGVGRLHVDLVERLLGVSGSVELEVGVGEAGADDGGVVEAIEEELGV